ncbi:hypothetical protein FQN52_003400 [Onygenales sp. PD_12]|nr:hypothetical protein FQN52_003400 [Onygenales sp. PD_12]
MDGLPISQLLGLDGGDTAADESHSGTLGGPTAAADESNSPLLGHQAALTNEASSSTIDESNTSIRGDQTIAGGGFNSSFLGGRPTTANRYNQSLTRPSPSRYPVNPTNSSINRNLGPLNQPQFTRSVRPQGDNREALIYAAGGAISTPTGFKAGCAFFCGPPASLSCSFRLENTGPTGRQHCQHFQRAALRAVVAALVDFPQRWDEWNCVVIASDSTYVLDGIKRLVNGRISLHSGGPQYNSDLWRLLFSRTQTLSQRHIGVIFRPIRRSENRAAHLAELACLGDDVPSHTAVFSRPHRD